MGQLEVGRPIPAAAAAATTAASAGGLLELVPAGGRPNHRDPLALARGGGGGRSTPGALERGRQHRKFAVVLE